MALNAIINFKRVIMKFETLMEIDLNKLKSNTKFLCKSYNDYTYKIANLKDNAYGMGLSIVNTLVNNGINYILVGPIKDALEIRKYNNEVPVLVNYWVTEEEVFDAINNDITLTITSLEYLRSITCLDIKDDLKLQILIDNGSNKIGLKNNLELNEAVEIIRGTKHLKLVGIYTDLTTIGVEDEYYYQQINAFYQIIGNFLDSDIMIHLNEPIMYHKKLSYVNGIRFDLALIGIEENINDDWLTNMRIKNVEKRYGDLEFPNIDLQLIFTITSEVVSIGKVSKGDLVGRNYVARNDMIVAVVPIGHKDGITKAINYVGINNFKRNILADDIDHLIVEIDGGVQERDKVYIINEERGIYDFLVLLKTNRYYLMSILNRNIPRVYINEESRKDNYL